jgi:ATP-dependent Lhr-like helicase
VRGGRFVSGFSGEQFALPEAAAALRKTAKQEGRERVSISAVDPLNLAASSRRREIARLPGNRLLFEAAYPSRCRAPARCATWPAWTRRRKWELRKLLIRRHQPGRYVEPPAATQ